MYLSGRAGDGGRLGEGYGREAWRQARCGAKRGVAPTLKERREITIVTRARRPRASRDRRRHAGGADARRRPYRPRVSPMKNSATVPGPVCEPMTVPMSLMVTLPLRARKRSSTRSRTRSASSRQAPCEMEHLPA